MKHQTNKLRKPLAAGGTESAAEQKKLIQEETLAAESIVKQIKWSLSGDPVTAGKQDGLAYWGYVVKDEKRLFLRINSENHASILDFNEQMLLDPMEDVATDASETFSNDNENDTRQTAYTDAFYAAEKELRENWIKENVGTYPDKGEDGWMSPFANNYGMADAIKGILNNPDSFKFVKYETVGLVKYHGLLAWKVDYYYRAQNGFGAIITKDIYLFVSKLGILGAVQP